MRAFEWKGMLAALPETPGSPWSRWMWGAIAGIAAIDALWLALTPVSLSAGSVGTIVAALLCALAGIGAARFLGRRPTIHTVVTGGAMLLAAWPALRLFNHLTMTTAFPLADPLLAAWDQAIGFDWLGYVRWLDRHPDAIRTMGVVYGSLTNYSIALFLVLACGREPAARCAEFVKLFLLTSIACMTIGMFFPALSAMIFYDPSLDQFQFIAGRPGTYHLEALHRLRTDAHAVLDMRALPGLVTFPSFHTAMGVIAIFCARHDRVLLAISAAINLTMIASTPLFGAHYGIDVIAGAAVAGLCVVFLRLLEDPRRVRGRAPGRLWPAAAVRLRA